jgi:uncharacterized protein involved in exopolysaccharide biosynthesis
MQDSFDANQYFAYLLSRWRFVASCCAMAAALAACISLVLPKKYTATASILIDAPAGNDPRAATAVSPVYLESLKTYEHFAASDTLFVRAIQRFKLREEAGSTPADTLKSRVLKVTKPRDTKLLEISATLADPVKAQSVAQFMAEETVNLNRSLSRQSDDEFTAEARRQMEAAKARLDEADKASAEEAARPGSESLESEVEGLVELKTRLRRELAEANVDTADFAAQQKDSGASGAIQRDLAGASARREAIAKELEGISRSIRDKESAAGRLRARLDRLEADRRAARTAYDSAMTRWNEAQATAGIRGERLKIIDPGIVPQRPSSPNLMLNVLAAVLIALTGALLYATYLFALHPRAEPRQARPAYR